MSAISPTSIEHSLRFLESHRIRLVEERDINDRKVLLNDPSVAVIGLVSRGKSTLVNKLIGLDLLPTGPNPVTFGSGFLSTGEPLAIGYRANNSSTALPVEVEEFRHRARRHDAQDIVDFSYRGALRLPAGVGLIDTKGLDEIK